MASRDLVVTINQGILRGQILEDRNNHEYLSFLGIPYATPPVGPLRFKAPLPPKPWDGVLDATRAGPCCYAMQDVEGENAYVKIEERGSEDCLYLNVFTKRLREVGRQLRPVMVWIHGGGFISGSGDPDIYGPQNLIAEDIVLVTINYRLGIFGFLVLDDPKLEITGNAGLKDQVMALRWVQENIEDFGGDPNNVTVFGESAGAASTHYLMLSPMCKGLFHKVIMMSGCAINCWARMKDGNEKEVAKVLGMDGFSSQIILRELLNLSTQSVFAIQKQIPDRIQLDKYRPFVPIVEKANAKEPFITKTPLELMISGEYNHVPVMIGYNTGESFIFPYWQAIGLFDIHFCENDESFVPVTLGDQNSFKVRALANRIKQIYATRNDYEHEEEFDRDIEIAKNSEEYFDIGSDAIIMRGVHVTIKRLIENLEHPIFFYKFGLETYLNEFKHISRVEIKGATHGDELNYLFHHKKSLPVEEGSRESIGILKMCKLWTEFARKSHPTSFWVDKTASMSEDSHASKLNFINWLPVSRDRMIALNIDDDYLMFADSPIHDRIMREWDDIFSVNHPNERY